MAITGSDHICHLQFTSGSTSFPKCVAVSQESVLHNIHAFMQQLLLAPFTNSSHASGYEGGLRLGGGRGSGDSSGDCDGYNTRLPVGLAPYTLSSRQLMDALAHLHELERADTSAASDNHNRGHGRGQGPGDLGPSTRGMRSIGLSCTEAAPNTRCPGCLAERSRSCVIRL